MTTSNGWNTPHSGEEKNSSDQRNDDCVILIDLLCKWILFKNIPIVSSHRHLHTTYKLLIQFFYVKGIKSSKSNREKGIQLLQSAHPMQISILKDLSVIFHRMFFQVLFTYEWSINVSFDSIAPWKLCTGSRKLSFKKMLQPVFWKPWSD